MIILKSMVLVALIGLAFGNSYQEIGTDSHTMALWHFNETSGSTIGDASGKSNSGLATGTSIVSGISGNARQFNGTTANYLSFPHSAYLCPTSQITIEGWFYVDSLTGSDPSFLDIRTREGVSYDWVLSYHASVDSILFEIGLNGVYHMLEFSWSGSGMSLRKWFYLVATYDGSAIKLYLNGQLKSSVSASGTITYTNGTLYMGRKYTNASVHSFHGMMDDIRISDIARTDAEIAAVWNGGTSPVVLIPYAPNPTQERRPTLQWHPVDSTDLYVFQLDTSSSFSNPLVTLTTGDTFFTPLADLPASTLYWRVGCGSPLRYSAPSIFTIQPDSVPFLYAFKGARMTEQYPVFAWKPVTRATSYRLQIDTSSRFNCAMLSVETAETSFKPLAALRPDTYYWRVSCDLNSALFSAVDSLVIGTGDAIESADFLENRMVLAAAPNPFKPSTTIRFANPAKNATLQILDIRGRLLHQWDHLAVNQLAWNAIGMPAGIYIAKLRSDGRESAQALFLMK